MRLKNRTKQPLRNIAALRRAIESFSADAVVAIEDFGGADLLIVKSQKMPSLGMILMGLPPAWLEQPELEGRLTTAAQHFGRCVARALSAKTSAEALRNLRATSG